VISTFASASVAARIERAECRMLEAVATGIRASRGDDAVLFRAIGGGAAVWAGATAPFNKVAGLAFADAPLDDEFDSIERAFFDRDTPVQAEVSSLGEPSIVKRLTGRGYRLIGFENVLGMSLPGAPAAPSASSAIEVRPIVAGELPSWIDVVATGFTHPDVYDGPESHESFSLQTMVDVMTDMGRAEGFDRYFALRDGQVAGGASMRLTDGIALLAGAATLPAHRRHGVQSLLLAARLRDAAARGADIAVVTTSPGSKSQQNVQRVGFTLLYVRAILIKSKP
jgi:GNAT superfamily N-acetyltransferase